MTINHLAVVLAAIAAFMFGAVWYNVLSGPWLAARGITKEAMAGKSMSPVPFVVSFISLLVMAFVLAGLLVHMGGTTLRAGLVAGALCWLGFVIPTMATNYAFHGNKPSLTLIDGGHWLGVLLIQGAIIGWFGP